MKASLKTIQEFIQPKKFAIAGVSRNPKKFSHAIFKELIEIGYDLYPVNPNAELILDKKCFKNIQSLPADIDRLFIVTPKNQTDFVLEAAAKKGIKKVWIQQGGQTKESYRIAEENKLELISKHCMFMFTKPESIHKFHASIKKLFGSYPK